jgi:hypothetical protein
MLRISGHRRYATKLAEERRPGPLNHRLQQRISSRRRRRQLSHHDPKVHVGTMQVGQEQGFFILPGCTYEAVDAGAARTTRETLFMRR